MAFTGTILTTKGLVLQNKVQAGAQLGFTKVKIGDGQLGSGQSLEALTDLISPQKTLGITSVAVIGDGTSRVRAVVTNTDLSAGFFVREIGVFATDPDDGEILYCVANAGNECDYLPTPTSVAVEQTLDILTAIGNATNVTAVINETIVLATVADITDHNNNSDAHNLRRWKTGHEYAVGDICFSKLLATDSYKYFECTVAGTSATTEPTWPVVGNTVTDGGVTWVVRDLRVATAQFDDSGKLATSAFVKARGLQSANVSFASASTALSAAHIGSTILSQSVNDITVTLPPTTGLPDGARIQLASLSLKNTTIATVGADKLGFNNDGVSGNQAPYVMKNGETLTIEKYSTSWFAVGGTVQTTFSRVLGTNGYQRLSNGLIIQWGTATATVAGTAVAFPVAFPNACYAVTLGNRYSPNAGFSASGISATGFIFGLSAGTADNNWIAIGS